MRLYYLTPAQHAIANIALSRIKISRFADLNDPFELLSVDLADRAQRAKFKSLKEEVNKNTGLLCMSKEWKSPLMWGHYADKHRGICLGFDVDDGDTVEVNYSLKLEKSDIYSPDGQPSEKFQRELMRTKFHDWKYENEVRVFLPLAEMESEGGLYFQKFSNRLALKEVILGSECPMSVELVRSLVTDLYAANVVKVSKARIAFTRFEVLTDKKATQADKSESGRYNRRNRFGPQLRD